MAWNIYFQSFQQLQFSFPFFPVYDVVIWHNFIVTVIVLAQDLNDVFTFLQKRCSKAKGIVNLTNHR